ncbi:hypothetical protein TREVI0001_2300 [Treponema vincentii ATCC 35580]|uniref:Uncharacterized protein n=1 Tax=Treponema vincentii ATCC 35580 TaxID=596324 RepID=C8PLZ8_9SPIR|nr:hypothetical protein TREVI0001_2300 [Treponema vincentii ATCC 35580]
MYYRYFERLLQHSFIDSIITIYYYLVKGKTIKISIFI